MPERQDSSSVNLTDVFSVQVTTDTVLSMEMMTSPVNKSLSHAITSDEQAAMFYLPMVLAGFVGTAAVMFAVAICFLFLWLQQCCFSVRRKFSPSHLPEQTIKVENKKKDAIKEKKPTKQETKNSKTKEKVKDDDKPVNDRYASHIYETVEYALPDLKKPSKEALNGTENTVKKEENSIAKNDSNKSTKSDTLDSGIGLDAENNGGKEKVDNNNDTATTSAETSNEQKDSGKKVKFDDATEEQTGSDTKKPITLSRRKKWLQRNRTVGVAFLMYLYCFFLIPFGVEQFYGRYLPILRINRDIKLNNKDCCFLLFTFWMCVALGRLLSGAISRCLFPNGIAIPSIAISILSVAVMCAYATKFSIVLWVFTASLGLCIGPFLSGSLVWADAFLSTAPKAIALAIAMAFLGAALFGWLGGVLIEYFGGSITIFYLTTAGCILHLLLYLPVAHSLGSKKFFRNTARKGHELILLNSSQTYV